MTNRARVLLVKTDGAYGWQPIGSKQREQQIETKSFKIRIVRYIHRTICTNPRWVRTFGRPVINGNYPINRFSERYTSVRA